MSKVKLTFLALIPLLALGFFGRLVAGPRGFLIGVVLAFIFLAFIYLRADRFALKTFRARNVSESAPRLKQTLDKLAGAAGITCPELYISPTKAPNAFALGKTPDKGAVVVTEGLLESLNPEEIEGVLAHEVAHIAQGDTALGAVIASCSAALWSLASPGRIRHANAKGAGGLALSAFTLFVAPVVATLVQFALSRSREFRADKVGAGYTNCYRELASALQKIDRAPNRLDFDRLPYLAHIFIYSSFNRRFLSGLFSTHPPVAERVQRLERMALAGKGMQAKI